ncbi:integrase [Rhizobium sp. BK181]|uniref:DUF6538 domain-containing protein n=1 Tax=Rhizobium sp. BK181 TaxID=2587072 RepID=UPI001613FA55|nr:DUF6538 domain-containing protein [Rhizobium sp. BK181]MBB3315154.1 integrase [Rhizobium sp. BK181]
MAHRRQSGKQKDPNRYLTERGGVFYYKRRIPTPLVDLDGRGQHVRISLQTSDLAQARAARDIYEGADDEYWASLTLGVEANGAKSAYMSAVKRAQAMGFFYRPAGEVAKEDIGSILQRIEAVMSPQSPATAIKAALGGVAQPSVSISQAFETYKDEIVPHELAGKSKGQRVRWTNGKQLAVDYFVEIVGDIEMDKISRDDARKFYDHWMKRIAPKEGPATHTPSHGNRLIGNLRVLYRSYFTHLGEIDRRNPFEKMSYKERGKKKRKRPSFPIDWIRDVIFQSKKLANLNDEARGVVLVVAQLGARPSEICNLPPEMIVLNHPVPHLKIEPRDDPEDPREIKTESSIRVVPLVGIALDVMKKHPNGFPRYKDKESNLSAALNKFFRENELFPTPKHTVYSFRHSFEDMMKEARVDSELRRILMGHSIDRPEYGEGGSLVLRQAELKKIELPYDPSIV